MLRKYIIRINKLAVANWQTTETEYLDRSTVERDVSYRQLQYTMD